MIVKELMNALKEVISRSDIESVPENLEVLYKDDGITYKSVDRVRVHKENLKIPQENGKLKDVYAEYLILM